MVEEENIYYPKEGEIVSIKDETPTIKTFTIKLSHPLEFKAGQFVQLTVPGVGEAPFTPSSKPGKSELIQITILRIGRVTDWIHYNCKVGDLVGVRGPFGKGYPIEKFPGAEILIVGGGVGLAPLRSCLYELFDMTDKVKRIVIKYGARTPLDLCFRDEYDAWRKVPKVELELTIDNPYPGWD
ncbi:MAG: FAD-binding oxidoreductase, partial [bacterium]